jgi:hypothetical protein
MSNAMLRAMQRAARQGNLKIAVPEQVRGMINTVKRHSFRSE